MFINLLFKHLKMDKIYAHADFIMQMMLTKLIQIILIYNFGVLRDCLSRSTCQNTAIVDKYSHSMRLALATSTFSLGAVNIHIWARILRPSFLPTCFLK